MYKKLVVCFLCIIVTVEMLLSKKVYCDEVKLEAISACLMDAETGRVLYEKKGHEKRAVASTTKILSCLVALEYGDLDSIVTISDYAAKMPDVQMNVKAGERYKYEDLLYGMMLESYNDISVAVAEGTFGSVKTFSRVMNEKALDMGCTDSYFITPNGLDEKDENGENVSSAIDMAKIASQAIKNKKFVEIVNTRSYTIRETDGKRTVVANNRDAFLDKMDGAMGIKTGFTGKAGYCFVGAVEQDGRVLVSVVLGCGWPPRKNLKWADTVALFQWGYKKYYETELYVDEKRVEKLYICDEDSVVVCKKNITIEIYINGYLFKVKNRAFY